MNENFGEMDKAPENAHLDQLRQDETETLHKPLSLKGTECVSKTICTK